jgi:formyltetrahydrofolate deformylase
VSGAGASTGVLLIECADRKGLIHEATGVLLRHGLNIVANDEFVDAESGRFFMRTETEGDTDSALVRDELRRLLPEGAVVRYSSRSERRLVVLVTKEYHCLGDLLLRHAHGDLRASIAAVVGNHDVLEPLARRFDVPFVLVPHEGRSREEHEEALLEAIRPFEPDLLVLAKYMRILGRGFIARLPSRMINIHHSFLPAFVGPSPYRQAAQRGVKIIGATAHFVTEELDEGPIVAQGVIPVDHSYSAEEMARAGRDVERTVLAHALSLVLEDRVFLCGNRTVILS